MGYRIMIIGVTMMLLVNSCFEEDQPVPPYVPPYDVESVALPGSLYSYQTYYDLDRVQITGEVENSSWALGFECSPGSYHIRVNSAAYWGIARTGSTRMEDIFDETSDLRWMTDKSDGSPDSTAVGQWVKFEGGDTIYTGEIMLIGQFNGISYDPVKKLRFFHIDDSTYQFETGDPGSDSYDTVTVNRNPAYQLMHYSIIEDQVFALEPPVEDWDLVFCQYQTILYTEDSIRAPYYVRGVLTNPSRVEIALDTVRSFVVIDHSLAQDYTYSDKQDAIGHDWKSVDVDESSNSAEYRVRPGYTYLIRVDGQNYYKLRFKSYYNESGLKGYASFEYAKLEPH